MAVDLGTSLAGVRLPFCAMNAPGVCAAPEELRGLAASRTGAIVLHTATVHPFVHPEFRALHNPGYDKLLPLARELAATTDRPVIASIAGATVDEYALLARAFADAGAALVELNLADPWVEATLAPCETADALRELLQRLQGIRVPLVVRLPDRVLPYARVGRVLSDAGVRAIVLPNEFTRFEKFLVEAGRTFDVVAVGGIASGFDVSHALARGARAVQVDQALVREGPRVFVRLEREIRIGRGERSGPV